MKLKSTYLNALREQRSTLTPKHTLTPKNRVYAALGFHLDQTRESRIKAHEMRAYRDAKRDMKLDQAASRRESSSKVNEIFNSVVHSKKRSLTPSI